VVAGKCPEIVKAASEFRDQYTRLGEKYYGLCKAVRDAKLQKKESTALLLALGLAKSRVSDLHVVAMVSDDMWARYSAQQIGFKAALEEVRSERKQPALPGLAATVEGEAAPKRQALILRDLTEKDKEHFKTCFAQILRPLHEGQATEYAYSYVLNQVRFYMQLSTSAK